MLESLLYGDGIFETVRVVDGRILAIERHLSRFEESCSRVGFAAARVSEGFEAIEGLRGADDGIWRITVTKDSEFFGEFEGGVHKSFRQYSSPISPALITLEGYYFPDDRWAEIKSTSYIRNIEARRAAVRAGADDAIMVSQDGRVGEASTSNCFVVFPNEVVTPPVEGILPGTRRAAALDVINISERPLHNQELVDALGVVLSSALGYRAAKSLNGRLLDETVIRLFEGCEDAL